MVGAAPDRADRSLHAMGVEEVTVATGQSRGAAPSARRRRWSPELALIPFVAVMVLLFVLPTLRMLSRSVLEPAPGIGNYVTIFENQLYRQVFATTFEVSLLVTLLSIVLAYPI